MDTLDDLPNERDWPKAFDCMVENQGMDTLDDLPNEIDWPMTFDGMVENQGKDTLDDLPIKRFAKDL